MILDGCNILQPHVNKQTTEDQA